MNQIIGLYGKKGSGKDTVCQFIQEINSNFVALAFATPIKESLANIHQIDIKYFNDPELKNQPLEKLKGKSPRDLMKWLGTDVYRRQFSDDIWIENMKSRIKKVLESGKGVIVTDCRYQNELEILKSFNVGVKIWHIKRTSVNCMTSCEDTHESEEVPDSELSDVTLFNNSTLKNLKTCVEIYYSLL